MSNILIIKHGSLGDIVQISGILRDIRESHKNDKIFILTTFTYAELLGRCPFIDAVLIDKRLPRWNILYLIKLKKMIAKYSFSKAYDLQNSARTSFYKKYIFDISDWSSSETAREKGMKKNDLTHESVLERFKLQLDNSNIVTQYSLTPDFSWAAFDVNKIINKYLTRKFILIFPLSSPKLIHKQWPYYNDLIKLINSKHTNIEIVVAPGPSEIEQAKNIDAISITNNNKALNIMELAGLIKKASFIIANDTGPAHMAAHLGASGIVLFGYHTTPKKVSIETDKFKAISVNDLNNLTVEKVYSEIKEKIELIN
mgnify:FL=1